MWKKTDSINPRKTKAKNGRLMEKSNCSICGNNKSKFVKGGALARYKAYIMSNFVTPAPSFASLGRVLAGQAFKGVKDNVDYYRKGKGVDIHKAILKVAPKKGFVMLPVTYLLCASWHIRPPQNASNFLCWLQQPLPHPMYAIPHCSSLSRLFYARWS